MILTSNRKRWARGLAAAAFGLLATAALPTAIAFAQSPPDPPARFVGTVTQSGAAASNGTTVEAHVGSTVCGSTTVFVQSGASRYALDVPAVSGKAGCGTDGAAIEFFVGGVDAGSGSWKNFQLNTVNLTAGQATAAPPTTAATTAPTPRATPAAPQTGTGIQTTGGDNTNAIGIALVAMALLAFTASTGLAVSGRR